MIEKEDCCNFWVVRKVYKVSVSHIYMEDTDQTYKETKERMLMDSIDDKTIISKVDKPNSYELGRTGNRHKIYYDTVEELVNKIEQLKKAGLLEWV